MSIKKTKKQMDSFVDFGGKSSSFVVTPPKFLETPMSEQVRQRRSVFCSSMKFGLSSIKKIQSKESDI